MSGKCLLITVDPFDYIYPSFFRSKIVKVSYRRKRFIVFVRGGAREVSYSNPQSIILLNSIKEG